MVWIVCFLSEANSRGNSQNMLKLLEEPPMFFQVMQKVVSFWQRSGVLLMFHWSIQHLQSTLPGSRRSSREEASANGLDRQRYTKRSYELCIQHQKKEKNEHRYINIDEIKVLEWSGYLQHTCCICCKVQKVPTGKPNLLSLCTLRRNLIIFDVQLSHYFSIPFGKSDCQMYFSLMHVLITGTVTATTVSGSMVNPLLHTTWFLERAFGERLWFRNGGRDRKQRLYMICI